jgi:pimeloyl-ACP methyl ester carboxylesterase
MTLSSRPSTDAAYLAEFLCTLTGPIVLVGHSYGGNVISTAATGNDQVQALVYFNGWMCDEGESQQQLLEAQADWTNLESPETYLGYQQGHNFASPAALPSTSHARTPCRRC